MTRRFGRLSARAPAAGDDAFLADLYASTRTDLLHLPVPADVVRPIIRHHQQLQAAGYAADFPDAEYLVLEDEGGPVGRAVLHTSPSGIRLVDLAIAPQARRRGHAACVLRALQEAAAQQAVAVTLRVRKDNPNARALYLKHGFVVVSADEMAEQMRWTAPAR